MGELQLAYMRRTRWEARIHAVEMGKVLAELLGGTRQDAAATNGKRQQRVSGADLLGEMGVKVRGKTR